MRDKMIFSLSPLTIFEHVLFKDYVKLIFPLKMCIRKNSLVN